MKKSSSRPNAANLSESSFGDRLRFVIWLSALRLGLDSAKELAAAAGKGPTQLSKWVAENPRPDFSSIRPVAELVGVSASWLDDPSSPDARVPELWAEWYEARRARQRKRA